MRIKMRTVQMTLDEELLKLVDKVVKELKTTRSSFTRKALREAIERLKTERLEDKHRKGYKIHPVSEYEFSVWAKEQDWGDE
jgi:metal-responsive CopG/Arc/MetJ family transcriptional regulator